MRAGDVVVVKNREVAPADLVILKVAPPAAGESDGDDPVCYVETKSLDGETNLKQRRALGAASELCSELDADATRFDVAGLRGLTVELEPPNDVVTAFDAVVVSRDGTRRAATLDNVYLRGTTVRSVDWILGAVCGTGADSKIMRTASAPPAKESSLVLAVNRVLKYVVALLVALCFVGGACSHWWVATNEGAWSPAGVAIRSSDLGSLGAGVVVVALSAKTVARGVGPTLAKRALRPTLSASPSRPPGSREFGRRARSSGAPNGFRYLGYPRAPGELWTASDRSRRDAEAEVVNLEENVVVKFFYYFLLMAQFVPVSLYVSTSMTRNFQARFMQWDLRMYHAETDTPCVARGPGGRDVFVDASRERARERADAARRFRGRGDGGPRSGAASRSVHGRGGAAGDLSASSTARAGADRGPERGARPDLARLLR